jgi:hypothetical protein
MKKSTSRSELQKQKEEQWRKLDEEADRDYMFWLIDQEQTKQSPTNGRRKPTRANHDKFTGKKCLYSFLLATFFAVGLYDILLKLARMGRIMTKSAAGGLGVMIWIALLILFLWGFYKSDF